MTLFPSIFCNRMKNLKPLQIVGKSCIHLIWIVRAEKPLYVNVNLEEIKLKRKPETKNGISTLCRTGFSISSREREKKEHIQSLIYCLHTLCHMSRMKNKMKSFQFPSNIKNVTSNWKLLSLSLPAVYIVNYLQSRMRWLISLGNCIYIVQNPTKKFRNSLG